MANDCYFELNLPESLLRKAGVEAGLSRDWVDGNEDEERLQRFIRKAIREALKPKAPRSRR